MFRGLLLYRHYLRDVILINKLSRSLGLILVTSIATVTVTYLISFVVGVYVFNKYYIGLPYLGTITYYLWVAVPIVIIAPLFLTRILRKMSNKEILIISVGIGVIYGILSFLIAKIYAMYLYDIPTKYPVYSIINYYYSSVNYILSGFLFSVSLLLITYRRIHKIS